MALKIISKLFEYPSGSYKLSLFNDSAYYVNIENLDVPYSVMKQPVNNINRLMAFRTVLKDESSMYLYADEFERDGNTYKAWHVEIKKGNLIVLTGLLGYFKPTDSVYIGMAIDEELEEAYFISFGQTGYYRDRGQSNVGYWCVHSITNVYPQRHGLYTWLEGVWDDSTDPYDPDPDPDYPNPDPDPDPEPIPIPDLPDISATDTGFLTLYNPTTDEIRALARYMWSDLFSLDTLKKMFADPMDIIIGCAIVPCDVPSTQSREVTVGNISTGVNMTVADTQYARVRCGSVKIPKHWDGYMDYSPYTKLQIFLPYIGFRQLNIDECMGKTLGVEYHIDCLTGSCTAFVTCNGSVFYEYSGQCSTLVPFTGSNWNSVIQSAVSIAGAVGVTMASGGASAPAVAMAGASTVNTVVNNKEDINKSSALGGGAGILGNQKPFICLIRPNQCVPANQNKFTGYPSYRTVTLGSISGFTIVEDVHLENLTATDAEKMEIENKLKSGVIL